jgi:hypothetical protein
MKALRTIVATVVIVFALTTVAVAGAQPVGSHGDALKSHGTPAAREMSGDRDRDERAQKAECVTVHLRTQQRTKSRGGGTRDHGAQGDKRHGDTPRSGGAHHGGVTGHDGTCDD